MMSEPCIEGILPIIKPRGKTSFSMVSILRRCLRVKKIGHAGTLDPFATGVMVMLVGQKYTRLSNHFLTQNKEYEATVRLGVSTDSFDCDGEVTGTSDLVPSLSSIEEAIATFQGEIQQIPPMFSAKKVNGKKLYELARQGKEIERAPALVTVETTLLSYHYPELKIYVKCSKGTYIRSIADELGKQLGCGGHLSELVRTRSGSFHIDECFDALALDSKDLDYNHLTQSLRKYQDANYS